MQPALPSDKQPNAASSTASCGHFVQFYEHENALLTRLMTFVAEGLLHGEACLVVATPAHQAALDTGLHAAGVNPEQARGAGRYVSFDAGGLLSRFMVDGSPDPTLFQATVGTTVAGLTIDRPVRVFGEMVALLLGEGNGHAAAQLEALWNDLGIEVPFQLFCAYPLHVFDRHAHGASFADICRHHQRVIPGESYVESESSDARSRVIAELQQKALALQAEIAERQAMEEALLREKRHVQLLNDQLQQQVQNYARVVAELEASRKELTEKIHDLELFHDLTVDRELKMMHMEKQLADLKQQVTSSEGPETAEPPCGTHSVRSDGI